MSYLYNTFIFQPLYNGLVGIMDLLPWVDVGIAVIIFTIVVKFILFPLSKSSLLTQIKMKEVEPEMNQLKKQYATDRQTQALKFMELYRSRGIKPFSGIFLVFIQLPILFALISVFYKIVPEVRPDLLYSFISAPDINPIFLGIIDLTHKSVVLSAITAIIQYFQLRFSFASRSVPSGQGGSDDFASQLTASMGKQMKYTLPLIAFAATYWFIPATFPQAAAIIALYWSVSSLFTLGQELYIHKKHIGSQKLA